MQNEKLTPKDKEDKIPAQNISPVSQETDAKVKITDAQQLQKLENQLNDFKQKPWGPDGPASEDVWSPEQIKKALGYPKPKPSE